MDCHSLLQGIFPTQGSNPGLPHCRRILYQLSHQGSPTPSLSSFLTKLKLSFCAVFCHSVVSDSATPWTTAHQAPLSMGFSRQEYWSGMPCPPPGDVPNPGIEPGSPALQADSLLSEPPGKLLLLLLLLLSCLSRVRFCATP